MTQLGCEQTSEQSYTVAGVIALMVPGETDPLESEGTLCVERIVKLYAVGRRLSSRLLRESIEFTPDRAESLSRLDLESPGSRLEGIFTGVPSIKDAKEKICCVADMEWVISGSGRSSDLILHGAIPRQREKRPYPYFLRTPT